MKMYIGLTKRNLLVFFKDKQSILFSMLTSIIVFGLYMLFLKGTFVDAINGVVENIPALSTLIKQDDLRMFSDLILLTGIMGSAMITVPYNCLTLVVRDREYNVDKDMLATPVKRWQIIFSYFTSAALSSIIMTAIILTFGLIILGMHGDIHMTAADLIRTYAVVALGSVSSTALFITIVMFFKTSSASGAFFGILSAVAGFVIGAYIPISQFSDRVQTVCNIFPGSHAVILLRNTLMNGLLKSIDDSIGGVDNGMFTQSLKNIFTFRAQLFGKTLEVGQMTVYIIVLIVVSIVIASVTYSRLYKD
ncbi:MAG: ABC transporter permease [Lachnospiraceae bacterium]|nr:ABC transporter permease [Lachnospiraceae bacterium]